LEAATLAPSAINRQPWRFYVEPDSITVSIYGSRLEFGISKRLDCGIAMLHIEVAALDCGVQGKWEFLEAPKVSRFTI
ncbi:MAG: nitroreductase family protein, partial [Dehalococcoidia bacterium]|nr:nitroreductase family protein [Dehalococcoidia bacterium]